MMQMSKNSYLKKVLALVVLVGLTIGMAVWIERTAWPIRDVDVREQQMNHDNHNH